MSQTSSRPPSEGNHSAYWFACAPNSADEDDCSQQSTNNFKTDNNNCFCTDLCPYLTDHQFLNNNSNNNNNAFNMKTVNPFMDEFKPQTYNRTAYNTVNYPNYTTSASNPTTPLRDTYWFAQTGVEPVVAVTPDADGREGRDGLKFDEKLRICRERQEEDRQRRLQGLELSSQQKEKYRQQLEEERRRKIDVLKVKDIEKRSAVEERKRLIWEAEQERKEAMVRRSLDRDNKLEAKRLAQRNNSSFVFGSSTPRTLDLDLPALGCNRSQTLLFATPNRVNQSEDSSKRRPISAYFSEDFNISIPDKPTVPETTFPFSTVNTRDNYKYRSALYSEQARACLTMYDSSGHCLFPINGTMSSAVDDHLMSQSLVSLHGVSRGRKRHTELTPVVLPRERILASSTGRINRDANKLLVTDSVKSTPKRAVSMTRLDQLAQPRRRYVEESHKPNHSLSGNNNPKSNLTVCLSTKSMSNLTVSSTNKYRYLNRTPSPSGQSPLRKGSFDSMTQLSTNRKTTKTYPNVNQTSNKSHNYSHFCKQNKEKSKSMVQLSARPPAPPPRHTRASKLRSQTNTICNVRSSLTVDSELNPRESALSPTRPISSMSGSMDGTTEVKRRVKPAVPRKPRPLSIGSPYMEKPKVESKEPIPTAPARGSRTADKQTYPLGPPMRPNRARSAGASPRPLSLVSPDTESNAGAPKPTPPRKPAHVKAAALARKATKQSEMNTNCDSNMSSSESKNSISAEDVKQSSDETPVPSMTPLPSIEPKLVETPADSQTPVPSSSDSVLMPSNNSNNKKDLSEDEYKKMMAEKRRLAREQAEREAEAERLRLEKEQQEEEERIRREEEEQRRLEEEQLRLIEIQKKAEEERLQKAMEENRLREEEESKRRAEEQRLRLEKEEKDKKAKEEAEQQRRELEERLKRDEEERLQRKKKLEAIMSRTRKTPTVKGSSPSNSPNETPEPEPQLSDRSNGSTPEKTREVERNHQNILKNEQKSEDLVIITTNSDINCVANNHPKPDLVEDADRAVLQNRNSEQNNGVSALNGSHISSNLINNNINTMSAVSTQSAHEVSPTLDQLINLNYSMAPNGEDVNSNPFTSNAFIATNGGNHKSQEQTLTGIETTVHSIGD